MVHRDRVYRITKIEFEEELYKKLEEHTWTPCTAFEYDGLTFFNDSFSPDGAQEYAVFMGDDQVESLTVSWMKKGELKKYVARIREAPEVFARSCRPKSDHPEGYCHLCA